MVFKSLTLFLICLLATLKSNSLGKFTSDELDINIDVSNLVAEFDEKINYSLQVKDNDVNVQKIEKILPDLDENKFFDLKVTSEKADIKKFEIVEINDAKHPNKKKKILLIEYQLRKNASLNFEENSSSKDKFITDIDFCICFKTKDFQVVKNKIFLRDVPFSNIDNNDENLKLKINLFNLPKNADIKKIDIEKSENYNADSDAEIRPPPVGSQMRKSYGNNDNHTFINQRRNENHHKFRVADSENNKNKINQNGKEKYSFNYDETFHKDSVSFLSINLTMVNKTDVNNTSAKLTEKANKKDNIQNKIKGLHNVISNNTNSEDKGRLSKKKKKQGDRYIENSFYQGILKFNLNFNHLNSLDDEFNRNEKFYFIMESSALIFIIAIVVIFSLINILMSKDKSYY